MTPSQLFDGSDRRSIAAARRHAGPALPGKSGHESGNPRMSAQPLGPLPAGYAQPFSGWTRTGSRRFIHEDWHESITRIFKNKTPPYITRAIVSTSPEIRKFNRSRHLKLQY
jgi:hypothetical protein